MPKYFGTDGFRGEANNGLNVDHAYKIGRFVGNYFGKEHRCSVVIGKDTRRSSYMFEYALVAGLTASGADASLLHVTTTPCVSYVTRTDEFDCGIMISASHNPYYDNGIKLFNSKGEKLEESVILEIEKYLDGEIPELPLARGEEIGRALDYAAGRNRYIGYLISLAVHSFKGKRIGLDCANGSASAVAKNVFEALGAKTYVINDHPNGFNINTNCGSTHIDGLRQLVIDEQLDAGFAFDGDADRCLAVDEKGSIVDGDKILYIYGSYMKERGKLEKNTVTTTVMSNLGLYKAFDELGINYAKTAVGDKYVYECMSENGYILGGENSGHIIFSKYANTGDGIITALKLMQVMCDRKAALSELGAPMKVYPQILRNVRVCDKNAVLSDVDVNAAVKAAGEQLGSDGRVLVRPSGTEPLLRIMVEAGTREQCEKYIADIEKVVREKGHIAE
ncbi:MAG: phosphoglucosamine mutase [Oscillospiraceae bacterium]